jgi:hypothetical protein
MRATAAVAAAALVMLGLFGCSAREEENGDRSGESEAPAVSSPVRFVREYVKVALSGDRVHVSGLYYFRNASAGSVEQGIEYPFPVDRFHPYPATVRVYDETGSEPRPMGFLQGRSSVRWMMRFGPNEERRVRVHYWQDVFEPSATYIVSSTQKWERPIELAEFEFRVPSGLGEVQTSFTPDRSDVSGDTIVYYMRREDFLPDDDLVVTWR